MPSTVEQLSPTRVKLTVEIPFSDLKPHLDKAYKDIAGQVNIPGFRKGKVPASVIDQRFGRGVVLQEAINEALPKAYQEAIAESGVIPLGQPEVDVTKLEDNDVVEFTAEVDIRPDFELPDFTTVEATVDTVEVTDDTVDERINLLRQRFATTNEVDRAAADGDVLTIDLLAAQDGKELDDATASGITYKIGEGIGMLDGLDEAVTGLKAGESATFTSTLVGGDFRGQDADITVTVGKVSEQELPEVDDEFAQMISEFDTVEEMKADLRKAVETQAQAEKVADARDKVLEAALAKTDFELPEAMLATELETRRGQIQEQLARGGMSVETYLEQAEDEDAQSVEEFWATIDERSEQAVRAQMLLDKYADDNSLEVSQEELTQLIFRKAQENNSSPQDEINHMMEHNHMGDWMSEIRRGKALALICADATVVDSDGNAVDMQLEVLESDDAEVEADSAESVDTAIVEEFVDQDAVEVAEGNA